jgi:ubiquinone/menaquinone biosynthesis C-methylase UbiE
VAVSRRAAGDQPDQAYFDVMAANSDRHWWYRARWNLVAELLDGLVPPAATAIDVGCGTGEVLALLADAGAQRIVGSDLSTDALGYAAGRAGGGALLVSRAERLPFPPACADVVVSLEVIEHLDSDIAALREFRRVLRPGGTLLVTVPAYESLWGDHDDWAGHRRRYGAGQLTRTIGRCGFEVTRTSYYFSFLVAPAFVVRRTPLRRLVTSTDEEASSSPLGDRVLSGAARFERAVLRRVGRLPFGLSILAVARAS